VTGTFITTSTPYSFNALSGVATSTEIITTTAAHSFANGDVVLYTVATGNTAVSGLSSGSSYYVIDAVSGGTTLKLSTTSGGTAINLTAGSNETGHTLTSKVQMKSFSTGGTANISATSITTLTTTARAIIKEVVDTTTLKLKRINLETTLSTGGTIVGQTSGATARIVNLDDDFTVPTVGVNANIVANVQTANAIASSLSVYDSGFGYINRETVTLTKQDSSYTITAIVEVEKQGTGAGFYSSTKGFLSSDKKIHDNDYYQEYSYEVVSKIPFDEYIDVLKQVTHVAGTKAFGKVDSASVLTTTTNVKPVIIETT